MFDPSPLKKTCLPLWGSWTREMLQTAEDTKHEDLYSSSRTLAFGTGSTWTADTRNHSLIHMESRRWLSKPTRQIQIVGFVSKHSELFCFSLHQKWHPVGKFIPVPCKTSLCLGRGTCWINCKNQWHFTSGCCTQRCMFWILTQLLGAADLYHL